MVQYIFMFLETIKKNEKNERILLNILSSFFYLLFYDIKN